MTCGRCESSDVVVRGRITAGGQDVRQRQCLCCGAGVGALLPRADHPDVERWDRDLPEMWEAWAAESAARRKESADAEEREWRARYDRYMASDEWRRKRARVFARMGRTCWGEIACSGAVATDVHHVDYSRLGAEALWDLRPVCRACHEAIHERCDAGGSEAQGRWGARGED